MLNDTNPHSKDLVRFSSGNEIKYQDLGIIEFLPEGNSCKREILPLLNEAIEKTQPTWEEGIWRPEATLEALNLVSQNPVTVVRGIPECGKGAILRAMTIVARNNQIPFWLMDMHRGKADSADLFSILGRATIYGGLLLLDSADYLYGNRRVRKLGEQSHQKRSLEIFDFIKEVRQSSAKYCRVVLSIHDEDRWQPNIDQVLYQEFSEKILRDAESYKINHFIESLRTFKDFLRHGPNPLTSDQTDLICGILSGEINYNEARLPIMLVDGRARYFREDLLKLYALAKRWVFPVPNYVSERNILDDLWKNLESGKISIEYFIASLINRGSLIYKQTEFREMKQS